MRMDIKISAKIQKKREMVCGLMSCSWRYVRKHAGWLIFFISFVFTPSVNAYEIINDMISPAGGISTGGNYTVTNANMQPYGKYTLADVQPIINQGITKFNQANPFLDTLSLLNSADPRIDLIRSDPSADYGSVSPSFIAEFLDSYLGYFQTAKSKFIYGALIFHPTSIDYLNTCARDIATAHIVFGDEYFIDGMDYRVFGNITDLDGKLWRKYEKTRKAAEQYKLAVSACVEAMTYSVGDSFSTLLGEFFTQGEFDIFNLACERFSMAMTELASLEYFINMSPDPKYEWTQAKAAFKDTVSEAAIETYIHAAVLGTSIQDFTDRGIRLLQNFDLLQQLGGIALNNLNILGYDNRFMPIADFSGPNGSIYPVALQAVQNAKESENAAANDGREYDVSKDKVQAEIDQMYHSYTAQLTSLTGVSSPIPAYPPDETYLDAVANAGHDLLDCGIETEADMFNACMEGKTEGSLGSKYRQIKQADLKVELAIQRRDQVKETIDMQQAWHDQEIQLISDYFTDKTMTLREFTEKWIKAQKNSRSKVQINTKRRDDGKWKRESKITQSTRIIEFDAKPHGINLDKEIALLELEKNKEIAILNANHDIAIHKLLMELANALIEINIAVQEQNAVAAEFFNLLTQKDNILAMYLEAEKHLGYRDNDVLTARIVKASSVLNARKDLEVAKHWTYLAAKTLEYKFLRPITNLSVVGETISIDDVLMAQTTDDLDNFLVALNGLNALWCGMQTEFKQEEIVMSVAWDILGLTNQNIDPENSMTFQEINEIRFQRFQQFVTDNMDDNGFLTFEFSTSAADPLFYNPDIGFTRWNVKNWHGLDPCGSVELKGLTVNLNTPQGDAKPIINLTHGGHYTFLDVNLNIKEYYPVKASTFINDNISSPTDSDVTIVTVANPRISGTPWDPTRTEWVNDLKGRSAGASQWKVTLRFDPRNEPLDYTKLKDIQFIMDTIGVQTLVNL